MSDTSRDTTEAVARCIVRLEELSDFLRGQMDAGTTLSYEQTLAYHIKTAEMAAAVLGSLEEHRSVVQRAVKKLVSQ
jgi:hypothetical protein